MPRVTAYFVLFAGLALIGVVTCSSEHSGADPNVYCFKNCNGHGSCVDFSCVCDSGYHGEDCSISFFEGSQNIPILSSGHFNLTSKNFMKSLNKFKFMLVGASASDCHKCIRYDPRNFLALTSRELV